LGSGARSRSMGGPSPVGRIAPALRLVRAFAGGALADASPAQRASTRAAAAAHRSTKRLRATGLAGAGSAFTLALLHNRPGLPAAGRYHHGCHQPSHLPRLPLAQLNTHPPPAHAGQRGADIEMVASGASTCSPSWRRSATAAAGASSWIGSTRPGGQRGAVGRRPAAAVLRQVRPACKLSCLLASASVCLPRRPPRKRARCRPAKQEKRGEQRRSRGRSSRSRWRRTAATPASPAGRRRRAGGRGRRQRWPTAQGHPSVRGRGRAAGALQAGQVDVRARVGLRCRRRAGCGRRVVVWVGACNVEPGALAAAGVVAGYSARVHSLDVAQVLVWLRFWRLITHARQLPAGTKLAKRRHYPALSRSNGRLDAPTSPTATTHTLACLAPLVAAPLQVRVPHLRSSGRLRLSR
jgi:hypothetical protein